MNKTRPLWKPESLEAHKGLQSQIQACGGSGQFGSANIASVAAKPSSSLTGITPDILYKMDDYTDNMANAVTKNNSVLDQLVVINAKQAPTISA